MLVRSYIMHNSGACAADVTRKAGMTATTSVCAGFTFHLGRRGVCAIPHPEKAYRGGEDAFVCHPGGVGVADGVGGYAQHGVDPALYTRKVMRSALEEVRKGCTAEAAGQGVSALRAVEQGALAARQRHLHGGCPVTMVTLVKEGTQASILNLGDCGTLMVRDDAMLFRSTMQQHSFNCPYQLPDDPPSRGELVTLNVQEGDIFLCASDGVYDNVELDDLLQHLTCVREKGCTHVAEAIGSLAAQNARNKQLMTPFARHAREAGYYYEGGKLDDITAVVAQVTSATTAADLCPELIENLLTAAKL